MLQATGNQKDVLFETKSLWKEFYHQKYTKNIRLVQILKMTSSSPTGEKRRFAALCRILHLIRLLKKQDNLDSNLSFVYVLNTPASQFFHLNDKTYPQWVYFLARAYEQEFGMVRIPRQEWGRRVQHVQNILDYVVTRPQMAPVGATWKNIAEELAVRQRRIQLQVPENGCRYIPELNPWLINGKKESLLKNKKSWRFKYDIPKIEGIILEPILSTERLIRESEEMGNCVVTYLNRCVKKRCFIFHLAKAAHEGHEEDKATLELTKWEEKFVVTQIEGAYGQSASPEMRNLSEKLLQHLNQQRTA